MISHINQDFQSLQDGILKNRYRRLRLPLNSKLEELNILRAKKLQILLWVRLRTQIYDGSEIKGLEERKIGWLRETRSENAVLDHGEIGRRLQNVVVVVVQVALLLFVHPSLCSSLFW